MPQPSYPNTSYTIGWISALPVEMAAAKGMLDEIHAPPQTPQTPTDTNSYLLGRMHEHNIVIACLPRDEIGPTSAAIVAAHMLASLPRVEVGLSVGVGSGIPHYRKSADAEETDENKDQEEDEVQDIRLGDVVIASDAKTGGLATWTAGKLHGDGSFEERSALNRPPRALRTALSWFEMESMCGDDIGERIEVLVGRCYSTMKRKGFTYPRFAEDVLFEAEYEHVGGKTCKECVRDGGMRVVARPSRFAEPMVHYGVVVTGYQSVSHAPTRKRIREEHGAICVDRQAAGLMNYFPCLVIRGISDYADSHKNDSRKAYAAATAAACAKEILEYLPVKGEPRKKTKERKRGQYPSCSSWTHILSLF